MAKTYYPFDAGAGGVVTETEWSRMARLWRPTGVVKGEASELAVTADGADMTVDVAPGVSWVRGFFFASDAIETLTIAAADPFEARIDRVVVRLDRTANVVDLAVLEGTPGTGAPPALTQDDVTWEVALAEVTVPANAAAISAGNVDDVRPMSADPEFRSGGDAPAEATGTAWVRQADGAYVPVDVVTAAEHTKALHDALGIDADTVDGFHGHAPTKAAHDALALNAATLDGLDSSAANVASTIAARNGSGDISTRLFRSEYTSTTGTFDYMMVQHALGTGDNYLRPATLQQVKDRLGIGAGGTQIATGSYTGNGAMDRVISLGFQPRFLYLVSRSGQRVGFGTITTGASDIGGWIAGSSAGTSGDDNYRPRATASGFLIDGQYQAGFNYSGWVYDYTAIG